MHPAGRWCPGHYMMCRCVCSAYPTSCIHQIMYGNVAPTGAVAKITGKEGERFQGTAKVFDSEEDMLAAISRQEICEGMVVVIRYEGPKGGQTFLTNHVGRMGPDPGGQVSGYGFGT